MQGCVVTTIRMRELFAAIEKQYFLHIKPRPKSMRPALGQCRIEGLSVWNGRQDIDAMGQE
jgi:hypothetical protein